MPDIVMLAKNYDKAKDKIEFPVVITEKLDGVMYKFTNTGLVEGESRQGKKFCSFEHLWEELSYLPEGYAAIGELFIPGLEQREISGKVRDTKNQCPEMQFRIFDLVKLEDMTPEYSGEDFATRLSFLTHWYLTHKDKLNKVSLTSISRESRMIGLCKSDEEVQKNYDAFMSQYPDSEGLVVRPAHGEYSKYRIGRSWGFLRLVPKPTKDLKVVGIEEAVSKDGEPKGMIGALYVEHRGQRIKVSAGSMPHSQRRAAFDKPATIIGKIVEVQYKEEFDTGRLREPRFKCIRDDKDKADG